MTAEHVLDHNKAPNFMDASSNYFETLSNLDSYLQYPPQSPYGVSDLGRKCSAFNFRFQALTSSSVIQFLRQAPHGSASTRSI